jgi:hypothetical protein
MGKKITIITLAVLALLSCENPVQTGLGNRVDITVPVVTMNHPAKLGDHVRGGLELLINAQDDIGVAKVQVAITKDTAGNDIPEGQWEWVEAAYDPESGQWKSLVDTTKYPDGNLPIKIKAIDGTGKNVVFEGNYSVKNGPPKIDLQIPAMIEEPTPERHMQLVSGGFMVGIITDLWGVAPGYPQIQFWPASEGELPRNPEAWSYLDSYASMSAGEWQADTGVWTALEFRFNAVDRDISSAEEEVGLKPGYYRFRFQAKDLEADSEAVIYPASGYYELEVITARELPVIAMDAYAWPPGEAASRTALPQYQRESFFITADISHTTGIYDASMEVRREGAAEATILTPMKYTENTAVGEGASETMQRTLETFEIKPGARYRYNEADAQGPDKDYLFEDGVYTFTVRGTSFQTSHAVMSLTIYIDTTPPEINITRVQPNVEPAGGSGPDEFTVNGFIAADMSSYDANNIGLAPDTSYREIKYLIKDSHDAALGARALYEDGAATFFDEPVAPVYKRAGSTASLIIDTTHFVPALPNPDYYANKDQYLYFIAKDKAGNYSYKAVLLHIDQKTDIPVIAIPAFDFDQRSQAALNAVLPPKSPNKLVDDRILSGTFTDDDGVLADPSNIMFRIYQDSATPGNPPELKADMTVDAGSLSPSNDLRTVGFRVALPPAPQPDDPVGALTLPDGIYSLEIVIKDDDGTQTGKNSLKPSAATVNLLSETGSTTTADGRIYFVLDTLPPEITETIIGNTEDISRRVSALFTLKGRVMDTNGLRSLVITQTVGGQSITVFRETYTAPGNQDEAWEIPLINALMPLPVKNVLPLEPDLRTGTFRYDIVAEDIARRTTKLTRTVVVDMDPPVLTVDLPAHGSWVSGDYTLVKGTETDYKTGPVFYTIKPKSDPAPAFGLSPGDYTTALGWKQLLVVDNGWSDTVTLTGNLAEGEYSLYVAAFDDAGNKVTNEAIPQHSFGVDQ